MHEKRIEKQTIAGKAWRALRRGFRGFVEFVKKEGDGAPQDMTTQKDFICLVAKATEQIYKYPHTTRLF